MREVRRGGRHGERRRRWAVGSAGIAVAVTVLAAGCTSTAGSAPSSSTPPRETITSTVGTSTSTRTVTTTLGTLTVGASEQTTVTASAPTVGPPPATKEPRPTPGTCPYLTNDEVMQANGQHTGQTSLIATKPYPVCVFTRSDGGYLATTRIVVAATAAAAAAAVDQHVPRGTSNPAALPGGWSGGAMGNLDGVEGYPLGESIYAVSKGKIAIIAISNQKQSIKGRQMVEDIIAHLGR